MTELNAGHQYWLDKGVITKEEAEEQQIKNDEAVKQCNDFLKQVLETELKKENPDQKVIDRLQAYFEKHKVLHKNT